MILRSQMYPYYEGLVDFKSYFEFLFLFEWTRMNKQEHSYSSVQSRLLGD